MSEIRRLGIGRQAGYREAGWAGVGGCTGLGRLSRAGKRQGGSWDGRQGRVEPNLNWKAESENSRVEGGKKVAWQVDFTSRSGVADMPPCQPHLLHHHSKDSGDNFGCNRFLYTSAGN